MNLRPELYASISLGIPRAIPSKARGPSSLKYWSREWVSNPRPAIYETAALPTELSRQIYYIMTWDSSARNPEVKLIILIAEGRKPCPPRLRRGETSPTLSFNQRNGLYQLSPSTGSGLSPEFIEGLSYIGKAKQKEWCREPDLHWRRRAFQARALLPELSRH